MSAIDQESSPVIDRRSNHRATPPAWTGCSVLFLYQSNDWLSTASPPKDTHCTLVRQSISRCRHCRPLVCHTLS